MIRPTDKQWNEFVRTYVVYDDECHVQGNFAAISKKAGVPYFEFLKVSWICAREHMNAERFCRINGEVPVTFFEKNIRNTDDQFEIIEKTF